MIASVHIADVGVRRAASVLRSAPRPASVSGLRHANVALAAPLTPRVLRKPDFGRVALVAFWDDDDALDRFLLDNPVATALSSGWRLRLQPLRAFGAWPGLPPDTPTGRTTEHQGVSAVLTLGRLRLGQSVRFLRTSAGAEARALGAPGLIWATGLGRPPFVATCSLWESTRALASYAYGNSEPAHPAAIDADHAKPFHHASAFIRFRPYGSHGSLAGRNPLSPDWMPAS